MFGRRLLVNPGVECAGSPSFSDETVVYRYNFLLDGEAKAKDFDVKIKGLGGMDTGHRLHVKKNIDDLLFYENGGVSLRQEPIDATEYEKYFADKDIVVSRSERVFTDQTDKGWSGTRLSKSEKLAVRRWTAIVDLDEVDDVYFSDGMRQLYTMGVTDKNYEINLKLDHP